MDCTVVSLLPFPLNETKPSLVPSTYEIPACKDKNIPSVLHVKDGISRVYMGDNRTFPAKHSAEEIARAIVDDYCNSQLESDSDARPAIFWLVGIFTSADVIKDHKDKIIEARQKQVRWFQRLVRRADEDWAATKQPRMISELQRNAATSLGMLNKEWMRETEPLEYIKCPVCGEMVDSTVAICKSCKHVTNPEKAKELGIKVA